MSPPPQTEFPSAKYYHNRMDSVFNTGTTHRQTFQIQNSRAPVPVSSYYSVTCHALRCLKRYLICYVITNVEHVTAFGSADSKLVLTCVGVTLQGKRSSFKPNSTAPCTAWPLNTLHCTVAPSEPCDKHLLKALSARRTLSNIRSYT